MDILFGDLKAKLDGSMVIKAYAREPEEIADFASQLDDAHIPRVQESLLGAAFSNISAAIGGCRNGRGVCSGGVGGASGSSDTGWGHFDSSIGGYGIWSGRAARRSGLCVRADGCQRRPTWRNP